MDRPICFGRKFRFFALIITLLLPNVISAKSKPPLIDVKIGLLESLSPKAPTSSDRYKRLLESALYYALGENEQKLQGCGYKITSTIHYFDAFDVPELINATQELENSGTWAIIGPRRTSHFITATKALNATPIISTMANSDQINNRDKLIFSIYPSASSMAKLMAKEANKKSYGKNYATLVDVRCQPCNDFAKSFRKYNTNGKEAFYLEVANNTPNLDELHQKLSEHPIDYLVIPNYSELTGFVIADVQKRYPSIKYIGADGWGEDSFSFLHGFGINNNTIAMAIRSGPQKKDKSCYHNVFSLDREINGIVVTPPYSIFSIVELVRILSDDLCASSAKRKKEFSKYLAHQTPLHFQKNPLYAIYHIKDGKLVFSHYLDKS